VGVVAAQNAQTDALLHRGGQRAGGTPRRGHRRGAAILGGWICWLGHVCVWGLAHISSNGDRLFEGLGAHFAWQRSTCTWQPPVALLSSSVFCLLVSDCCPWRLGLEKMLRGAFADGRWPEVMRAIQMSPPPPAGAAVASGAAAARRRPCVKARLLFDGADQPSSPA
jgi:hypothetical protein